jgi:type IV secretory pathway VirD2 relaxase
MAKDRERQFRLRPRKPVARSERATWVPALKIMMHYARMSRIARRRSTSSRPTPARPYFQRCSVRVTYAKNSTRGQWRAHGRYIARDSATREHDSNGVGFDGHGESIEIAARLETWQKEGDERLWKLILSPEFGERLDLQRLTRELLSRMEKDLGIPLEWVAATHFNTEHPHIHVALRGVGTDRSQLRLGRDYIKQGIRSVAEDLCTRQIGYRTELDADAAQRREVREHRYTSLDRIIERDSAAEADQRTLTIAKDPNSTGVGQARRLTDQYVRERLISLETLGLSQRASPSVWHVRDDFADILRAMQRSADRQKTLAAHGVLKSDDRLPMAVLNLGELTTLEGRILVHGEEESSGRRYLMLEGTDGRVHYVYYTPEMDATRNHGGLQTNSFVKIRGIKKGEQPAIEIEELGDSEALLHNKSYFRDTAQRFRRPGILPPDDAWDGWLGRYQQALREAVAALEIHEKKKRERNDSLDRGR